MSNLPSRHSPIRPLATFIATLALTATTMMASAQTRTPLAASVNTLIGTQDEGNTFPGASAPFGMIQASPIGSHYAGWRYGDEKIRGFGHAFLSGAGCWEQGGQVSVLPVTGTIAPGGTFDAKDAKSFDQKKYASRYTLEGGADQAGYYKVKLTDYGGIDVEATASPRAAVERYTFAPGADVGHVLVNVGQANEKHRVIGSEVRVVGDRAIEGKITTISFCVGHQYSTWFRIEFDRPFTAFGVWGQQGATPGARFNMESEYEPLNGAWASFPLDKSRSVSATVAISHVDAEGARANLRAEGMRDGKLIGFDAMRASAQREWERELSKVKIDGGSADDRSVFYTALYHAFLQPMTGSDADGRYRGYDEQVHRADGWTYYEYFSLWDTYRAQNQLLALLQPRRAHDIGRTMIAIDAQNGWLPRWGYGSFDTNTMTGDPVTPFMADLWRYGMLDGLEADAWKALRKNAWEVPPLTSRSEGRAGNANYLAHGFVQFDKTFPAKGMDVDPLKGGSATLEYAVADCALAQMAQGLGHADDARALQSRAGNWRNLWDAKLTEPESAFVGFPRPKLEGGAWYAPPSGTYSPRSSYGFHEGTAWQYQWLVPQDVPSLATAMGGREQMGKRLDTFFAWDEIGRNPQGANKAWVSGTYDYYSQYRFNPNNEPNMQAPSMYSLIGMPWKTAGVFRAAQTLFTNRPNGVTGNDDLGTMSAWYLFSTLGFSPLMPGTGHLLLSTPRFPHISIDLGQGRVLKVDAANAVPGAERYVSAVSFDGKPISNVWLDVDVLRKGGMLKFALVDTPDPNGWGTRPQDAPAPACPAR